MKIGANVKTYTLECGCLFERSKKAGIPSFELAVVCDEHEGTAAVPLSSPPADDPFVDTGSSRDRDWILALTYALRHNGIEDSYVLITPDPHAAQGWLADVLLLAARPYLGSKASIAAQAAKDAGIEPMPVIEPPPLSEFTHCVKSNFAKALENGAVLDELEHTQPVPVVHTRGTTIDVTTGDKPLYIQMRNAHGGLHYVCVDCGCEQVTGHHRFCKFHVG